MTAQTSMVKRLPKSSITTARLLLKQRETEFPAVLSDIAAL
jgi:hypothetical protein